MKVVLLLPGGGSLGAFAAGAWKVLGPRLRERGARVVAVAGTSIGAVNGAILVQHLADPDGGASVLERFWRERVATPSFPFSGAVDGLWAGAWSGLPGAALARSWNGLLTSVLIGNRALHRAAYPSWNLMAAMRRLQRPLLNRTRMWRTLDEAAPGYRSTPDLPLLGVAAVDVLSGELVLFDSDRGAVGPDQLMASSAIPLLYEAVEVDGRLYWDGDMTRDSLLEPLLSRLLESRRLTDGGEPALLLSVEQRPRRLEQPPMSSLAVTQRLMDLLQLGKLDGPQRASAGLGEVLRVTREALPNDDVSRELDYSPERIDELIDQGESLAASAWADWESDREPRQRAA